MEAHGCGGELMLFKLRFLEICQLDFNTQGREDGERDG